jgi:protein-S-isoprenylcysteine O-methyltransferase Ste14
VTVLVPWLILSPPGLTPVHWAALVLLGFGAGILFRCIREFAVANRGTLAAADPPKYLVVSGLHRYVRNPMYMGVVLILAGEAWTFGSAALAI